MKNLITVLALSLLVLGSSDLCMAASEQVLYTFTGNNNGGNPYSGPILDSNGNLYGTTVYGGDYGYGAAFELSPGKNGQWTETVLHSFNLDGQDGIRPYSSLVMDPSGNLYGTASNGGGGQEGIVFELSPNHDGTWQETILYTFDYTHGGLPLGGLVWDRNGNLYGTTEYGGDFQHGTVFQLKHRPKGKWQEIVLHSFNPGNGDGFLPYAGLAIDKSSRLYGTTLYGGNTFANGAVFELRRVKGVWQESVIHSFSNQDDGFYPYGPVAIDAAGRLYGTTWQSVVGGVGGAGIVFQLSRTKQVWQETILHQFVNQGDGGNPYSGVVLDSLGNIYGTTYWGGNFGGTGVIFEVVP